MPPHVDPDHLVDEESFRPAYLDVSANQLRARIEAAVDELRACRVCPRDCDVDRLAEAWGVCRTGRHARVSSFFAHHGEEDCLRGWRGSGTIFFSWCNLRCVFCQNFDISQRPAGAEVSPEQIAEMALHLQAAGCHNINFVTPEHVVPQVIEALGTAIGAGLQIPVVYNTSAYDSLASIRQLDGLVDIYMPDFKLWRRATARRLLLAPDYPEAARQAIAEMHRQVGPLVFDRTGVARRGVLVRHLVMPGLLQESAAIFRWLATALGPDTFVNVMDQYRPSGNVVFKGDKYADIARPPRADELEGAYDLARDAGLHRFDLRVPGGLRPR